MENTATYGRSTAVRETSTTLHFQPDQSARSSATLVAQVERAYRAGYATVMIDMSAIPELESSGIQALRHVNDLIQAAADKRRSKRRSQQTPQPLIMLLNPSPEVKRVLETLGITALIDVYNDL